jgi:hypothetical protein
MHGNQPVSFPAEAQRRGREPVSQAESECPPPGPRPPGRPRVSDQISMELPISTTWAAGMQK